MKLEVVYISPDLLQIFARPRIVTYPTRDTYPNPRRPLHDVYNAPASCGHVHTIRSGRIALEMNRLTHESLLKVPYGAEHCKMPESVASAQKSLSGDHDSAHCRLAWVNCLRYPNTALSPGRREWSIEDARGTHDRTESRSYLCAHTEAAIGSFCAINA